MTRPVSSRHEVIEDREIGGDLETVEMCFYIESKHQVFYLIYNFCYLNKAEFLDIRSLNQLQIKLFLPEAKVVGRASYNTQQTDEQRKL